MPCFELTEQAYILGGVKSAYKDPSFAQSLVIFNIWTGRIFLFTKLQEISNFETQSFILIPNIILDTLVPQSGEF